MPPQALEQTKKRLEELSEAERKIIILKQQSHASFEEANVKLIVYNLGYLPGGEKTITTQCETTLESIRGAMDCLSLNGALSITCYPGHTEGAKEQEAVLAFLSTLCSKKWLICHHQWLNRPLSPTWIWMQALPHA